MMKSITTIHNLLLLVLVLLANVSCSEDEGTFAEIEAQGISFNASVSGTSSTRGTLVKKGDKIQSMGVYAYNTGRGTDCIWDKRDYVIPNLLRNLKVEYKNQSYQSEYRVEWPRKADANVSFLAYSPYISADNGLSIKSDIEGLPVIHYQLPSSCEKQPDLMISALKKDLNVLKDGDKPVNFEMKHVLTTVSFKARGIGQITTIAINSKIYNSADLILDKKGHYQWTNLQSNGSGYYYDRIEPNVELNGQFQKINSDDGYYMMIPQQLPKDATIWVYLKNLNKWITFDISGKEWKVGQHVCYNLDVKDYKLVEEYTIRNPYVGAFWKANQTGERIIRMEVESKTKTYNSGSWKVEVEDWGDFNSNDICFSTDQSPDKWVYTNSPHSAEYYRVAGTSLIQQKISELKEFNGKKYIYFRIGLNSRTSSNRYALVKLSYGHLDNPKKIKEVLLYLRQGESPDYVINQSVLSKKISPYNLTDPDIDNYSAIQTERNKAESTDYPSQAGVFYRWAGAKVGTIGLDGIQKKIPYREAFSPVSRRITAMGQEVSQLYWGNLYSSHKVSPSGRRRPRVGYYTDYYGKISYGNIYSNVINDSKYVTNEESFDLKDKEINYSELTQSLFYNIYDGMQCSQFGYYADGYFDRLPIQGNAVRPTKNTVAYAGRLFYNPETKASVFFPACGYRDGITGKVKRAGEVCRIWTSGAYRLKNGYSTYMHRAVCLEIGKDRVGYSLPFRSEAVSIRCVVGDEEDKYYHHDDDDDDEEDD